MYYIFIYDFYYLTILYIIFCWLLYFYFYKCILLEANNKYNNNKIEYEII